MKRYLLIFTGILMLTMNANASFPVDEAGIVAYVSVGSSADLNNTYAIYEDVLDSSATHIIGTVRIANINRDSVPLVYVGADGWVVAYYPKAEPASKIMQWNGYSKPYVNTTTLADAISKMATALGVSFEGIKGDIKYYDFRYPEANLMTMIVETSTGSVNSYNLTIPETMTLYNASYSHFGTSSFYSSTLYVDGDSISSLQVGLTYGYYNITRHFKKDVPHNVRIYSPSYNGASTVLIYRN